MNNFVWGIDLVEEQFLGSCGIPSRPYMSKKPVKCIAEFSVNAQKTGKLLNVDWVDVSVSSFTCTNRLLKFSSSCVHGRMICKAARCQYNGVRFLGYML